VAYKKILRMASSEFYLANKFVCLKTNLSNKTKGIISYLHEEIIVYRTSAEYIGEIPAYLNKFL
jgi:hypothetical protein